MHKPFPTLTDVQALDSRIFATLTPEESAVLDFYLTQGRKFDVSVAIINETDPNELAAAGAPENTAAIMKRANNRVSVTIGPSAKSALAIQLH